VLTPHAEHLYAVRNLVFFVTHALAGIDPLPYYASSLALHGINAALLFGAILALTGRPGVALLASGLWAVAPIQHGVVGWYSAFGHQLTLLFLLIVLRGVARCRRACTPPGIPRIAVWYGLLLLGACSYGVGIGLAVVSGPAIYLLLRDVPHGARTAVCFGTLAIVTPLLYTGLRLLDESSGQVMSASPLGFQHIAWRVMSRTSMHLAAHGITSLLVAPVSALDGAMLLRASDASLGMMRTIAFLVAPAATVVAVVAALRRPRRLMQPLCAIGIWVAVSYGLIAAGRTFMLAMGMSMTQIALQHRYHYTATALLAIALGLVLAQVQPRESSRRRACAVAASLWLAVSTASGFSVVRLEGWSRQDDVGRAAFESTVAAARELAEAARPDVPARIPNVAFRADSTVLNANFPGVVGVHVIAFPEGGEEDERLRYVEFRPERLESAAKGPERTARLLVAPLPGESLALPRATRR
jgi:hypothetical protein